MGRVHDRPEPEAVEQTRGGEGCADQRERYHRPGDDGAGAPQSVSPVFAPAGRLRRQERVENREHDEGRAGLLDDEGEAHEDAADKEGAEPPGLDRLEQDERAGHGRKQDEVLGVCGEPLKPRAERQNCEDGRRRDGGRPD